MPRLRVPEREPARGRDLSALRQPGTARYVGLQTMDGIAATANCLVDDLDVEADGRFEAILSADEHEGNWLRLAGIIRR